VQNKKPKGCGPTDLLDDAGFKPRECERATVNRELVTSIPGPAQGPLGPIGVVSPPFTQDPDTRLETLIVTPARFLGTCATVGPSASYAYYQATELPGDEVVAYVTRFESTGPYLLKLPDKTGAIDFFIVSALQATDNLSQCCYIYAHCWPYTSNSALTWQSLALCVLESDAYAVKAFV
jgi:hypothetical protein